MEKYNNIHSYKGFINLNESKKIDIKTFPNEIQKTLDEYAHVFKHDINWNEEQDKHGDNFNKWYNERINQRFIEELPVLIELTQEDLNILELKKSTEKELNDFEDLIKDAINTDLSKIKMKKSTYDKLSSSNDIDEMISQNDTFDENGEIDFSKLEEIEISTNGFNLPNFERFVKKNPDFQGIFDKWKQYFDANMDAFLMELNAFRNSTLYIQIKKLNLFLKNIEKSL